jgi:two-component system nitrate/nitrite response regulator NarL
MLATHVKPISVLLVEDHKCVMWGLERLIGGESPRLRVAGKATNRKEALVEAARCKPDIILLDLDLSGEMSVDLLPELLATSDAKVLVLTGTRDPELRSRAMVLGARGVILKTEEASVILRAIERVYEGEVWLDRTSTAKVLQQLAGRGASPEARKILTLTPRERQIIASLVLERGGGGNKSLAAKLFMSEHTLRNHLTSIYGKLEVRNRLELYMYAVEHGLAGESSARATG